MKTISVWILTATTGAIGAVTLLLNFTRWFGRSLKIADRLRISGGYESPPPWLQGKSEVTGRVSAFVNGDPGGTFAEVKLTAPLIVDGKPYPFLLLRLRYRNARWRAREIVHVEVWSAAPSQVRPEEQAAIPHEWVESHASYRRLRS